MANLKIIKGLIVFLVLLSNTLVAQTSRTSNTCFFYFFHIQEVNQSIRVTLLNKEIKSGEYKITPSSTDADKEINKIWVSVVEKSTGTIVYETIVDNPLSQQIEYVNEKDQLDHVTITQTEGDFHVKIPISMEGMSLRLELISDNNSLTPIATF